ncbi:hypothetical protein SAMN05216561_1021, partial [Nocardioides psychrotolerans]
MPAPAPWPAAAVISVGNLCAANELVHLRLSSERLFDYTRRMTGAAIDPHEVDDDAPTPTNLI